MIWPDNYDLWTWIGLGVLAFALLVVWARAWWRRWGAPGMRFPAQRRMQGVKVGLRARLVHMPLYLRGLAMILFLIALSRPQLPDDETAEVEGIDIVVAFDMSGSMATVDISDADLIKLQNDNKEPQNRFIIAIDVLREFISSRQYDRVCLVIFGKAAFLQFPLTLDYGVMLRILDQMSLNDIDGSTTVIGNALGMSLRRLKESEAKTQLVILLTDGEDNGSNVSPLEMAKEAKKRGVKVFPILVGTNDQSRQPTDMQDMFTGQRIYRKVDQKVNPALLKKIAKTTGGRFYQAADRKSLAEDFVDILDEFEKTRLVDHAAAERTEMYPWFLFPGLALLFLELLLSQTVLRRFP